MNIPEYMVITYDNTHGAAIAYSGNNISLAKTEGLSAHYGGFLVFILVEGEYVYGPCETTSIQFVNTDMEELV